MGWLKFRVTTWLSVGSVIPVVGWLYGVSLLWDDDDLSLTDKLIGTLLVPFGFWGFAAIFAVLTWHSGTECVTFGDAQTCRNLGIGLIPSLILLGIAVAATAWGPSWVHSAKSRAHHEN